ncbi:Acyl-CoA N-acyltransferase [Penicillium verhagenii]|nr:Acyl-CoA N-acyltransferase [Penicillium verhagenii]
MGSISETHIPVIYEHDDKATTILPLLASHLPLSTSLLRRIQHGIANPTPTAKILATFPQSAPPSPDTDTPWLAARVDLFRGRETQIILYSSLEAEHTSIQPIGALSNPLSADDGSAPNYSVATLHSASPASLQLARVQLLALLAYIKASLLPGYLASLPEGATAPAQAQSSNGVALIPAPDPRAFLIGSLHTGLFTLLLESGEFPHPGALDADAPALRSGLKVHRYDNPPYSKFFFRREVFTVHGEDGREARVQIPLPPGYRFCDRGGRTGVQEAHLDLVQSRTSIPRSRAQLMSIPGVAVYWDGNAGGEEEEEMPIAWAFLGVDGPLATLHVEPEHRGKGLALCLSKETMRRGMDPQGVFGADRLGFGGSWR